MSARPVCAAPIAARPSVARRSARALSSVVAPLTLLGMLAGSLTACGPFRRYQRYEPAPLDVRAPAVAAAYRARQLDDPALRAFLRAAGVPPEPPPTDSGWTPRQLAVVALYQRANVAEARAALAAVRATTITAGLRPEATGSATVERASVVDEGRVSPWTLSLTTGLTFETGGKRAARLARARAGTLAARLRLDAAGWAAAQAAAQAAVALLAADRDVRGAEVEGGALRDVLTLLRTRYAEGRVSLADVAQAEAELRAATLATAQARAARTDGARALARALAVPVAQIERLHIRPSPEEGCDAFDALPPDALQVIALQRRFDVGAVLAEYAVSEADVRAEIARQYPDVTVGPGLAWDQGVRRWALGIGTPGLPRARNRGLIAEALARRAVQAVRVRVVQDSIVGDVDGARATCAITRTEVVAADSLRGAAERRMALARAAYARGETGRTEVALADLALVRADRARQRAAQRRTLAGVALETAVGVWLSGTPRGWPDLMAPALPGATVGHRG